jgi:hypothetical protein
MGIARMLVPCMCSNIMTPIWFIRLKSYVNKIFAKQFGAISIHWRHSNLVSKVVGVLHWYHGLPKLSHRPTVPNPSTPYSQETPETTLRPIQGWPFRRAGGLQLTSTPLGRPTL